MLFGAGAVVPANIEPCIERRYFTDIHYLALVADDTTLRRRLMARPAWRGSSDDAFVAQHLEFSKWLRTSPEAARYDITIVDAGGESIVRSADRVEAWIRNRLTTKPAGEVL